MLRTQIIYDNRPSNFGVISKTVSCSAQPSVKNLMWLKENGYTDVINFRTTIDNEQDFNEKEMAKKIGLKYHWLPTNAERPTILNVMKFLNVVRRINNRGGKVLLHCKAGADRTGMYVFLYKTKNHINTTSNNIEEWKSRGHHYILYPHMITWARCCAKRLFEEPA